MNVFRLVLFVSLLISFPAFAAQLTLVLKDKENKPVKDVVAALVPAVSEELAGTPPAEMDQREKMFMPHVLAIKVNTLVRFPNSDDIRHHVYSFSPAKKFELRLYHGSTAEPVLFDKPGTVVLGCNIHDSMVAYIYVLETNYFAVSDEQGKLQINAPGGRYQLQIQHPHLPEMYSEPEFVLTDEPNQEKVIALEQLTPPASTEPVDEFSTLF